MDNWRKILKNHKVLMGHVTSISHMTSPGRTSCTQPNLIIWTGPHRHMASPASEYIEYLRDRARDEDTDDA